MASLVIACASPTGEPAPVSPPENPGDPAVTVDALLAVLLEELPADAARNMGRGEPTEAFAKGMRRLIDIAERNEDWTRAVTEVGWLADSLAVDLTIVEALVTRVIDGDTIDVVFADGTTATVRNAYIDAPEVGERCSGEATALNRAMVEGKIVTLKLPFDPENRVDRYGRLVRHVWVNYPPAHARGWVGDMWVNWYLVLEGFAQEWGEAFYPQGGPGTMAANEIDARVAGRGCVWRS